MITARHISPPQAALVLMVAGTFCMLGNLFITFQRSTIPRSLNDVVIGKEIGYEKHPGKDDVNWLLLGTGEKIHVDQEVWLQIDSGATLRKERWSTRLEAEGRLISLHPSDDFPGMIPTMLASFVMIILLLLLIRKESIRRNFHTG